MSILQRIKESKVEEVAGIYRSVGLSSLMDACRDRDPTRDFTGAVARRYRSGDVALIAEIKKASPSKGLIRPDFDVSSIASAYTEGGAACLSVLTDSVFFQGSPEHLSIARETSCLPILRKDFIIDPIQIFESRAMGADCILLIVAMLERSQALELEAAAIALGLHVLVEVHDEIELERALAMQGRLIGINNRDLSTFEVDLGTTSRLARHLDQDRLPVSESGISGPMDVVSVMRSGVRAILAGEVLMRQRDIASAARTLTSIRATDDAPAHRPYLR